jgi:hypothetical protein
MIHKTKGLEKNMKKAEITDISVKSTKDQILAAYHDVLAQLTEKQVESPQEAKKKHEEKTVVIKAAAHSPDAILSDLSGIKLKSIKQLDILSEELLSEFQKLSDIHQAIDAEQKHLEELYQIKETAHTLAALLQTHAEQKEQMKREMEQQKKALEESMSSQRSHWKEENAHLERDSKEQREKLEKERKREEEEYTYDLDIKRRKEMDDYNVRKAALEKELLEMKEDLQKRELSIVEKEKILLDLQSQVERFPEQLKQTIAEAEEKLRSQLLQQHTFESQLKEKEQEGLIKLNELRVTSLQAKIKEQEILLKELNQKTDQATQQVQLIACRALDVSAQRFASPLNSDEKTVVSQKKD